MSALGEAFQDHPIALSFIALLAFGVMGEVIEDTIDIGATRDMSCVVQQTDQGSNLSPGTSVRLSCTLR